MKKLPVLLVFSALCAPALAHADDDQTGRLQILFETAVPSRLMRCIAQAKPGTLSAAVHPKFGSLEVLATCDEDGEEVVGETLVQPEDAARLRFAFRDVDGKKVVLDLARGGAVVAPEQLLKALSAAAAER